WKLTKMLRLTRKIWNGRLCVVSLHVSKAFRSAFLWHALARDDFEPALATGLLVLGVDKATVQSYGERWSRRRQRIPLSLTPIDELPLFFSQFRLHPFGYPLQISVDASYVDVHSSRQHFSQ